MLKRTNGKGFFLSGQKSNIRERFMAYSTQVSLDRLQHPFAFKPLWARERVGQPISSSHLTYNDERKKNSVKSWLTF